MAKFKGAYKDIYEAGRVRLKEREAERTARSLAGAARSRVRTSGVSQIPLARIGRESARAEGQLGAEVSGMQEQERLRKVRFGEQKELMKLQGSLSEAAAARLAKRQRQAGKAGLRSSLIGGVFGAAGSYLGRE